MVIPLSLANKHKTVGLFNSAWDITNVSSSYHVPGFCLIVGAIKIY